MQKMNYLSALCMSVARYMYAAFRFLHSTTIHFFLAIPDLRVSLTVPGARYSGHSGGSDTRIPAQLQQYYAQ